MKKSMTKHAKPGVFGLLMMGLVLIWAPGSLAADQTLPSADTILNKYIEATGGRAAYQNITNRVAKATLDLSAQGMQFDMTVYSAKPNLNYLVMESEAIGKVEQGTDGEVAWELSVMTGPRIIEGQERLDLLREAQFDKYLDWKKFYQSAECVGVENISDKMSYKVVLTPKDGKPQTIYIDQDSHFIVRQDMTMESPMGSLPVSTYLSDYRDVEGIKQPHTITVAVAGQERVMTVQSIEQNVDLPKDRFALPDEIKALMKKDQKPE